MSSDPQPLLPATVPFGSSHSILGLLLITMFIERSHMLTIPSTLALIRLMLAELSRPHGCDSGRTATGYIVGGLYTVRYLAALPRRVLLMGQQVLSCVARRTSTEATSRRTEGLSKNRHQPTGARALVHLARGWYPYLGTHKYRINGAPVPEFSWPAAATHLHSWDNEICPNTYRILWRIATR